MSSSDIDLQLEMTMKIYRALLDQKVMTEVSLKEIPYEIFKDLVVTTVTLARIAKTDDDIQSVIDGMSTICAQFRDKGGKPSFDFNNYDIFSNGNELDEDQRREVEDRLRKELPPEVFKRIESYDEIDMLSPNGKQLTFKRRSVH